jgi:hypothetical protein
MLNNTEKLLAAVLLLTQEDETFYTVYMKIPLLMNHAHIDTPNLVKMEKTKKYSDICEAVKPQEVQNDEDALANSRSLYLQNFEE